MKTVVGSATDILELQLLVLIRYKVEDLTVGVCS